MKLRFTLLCALSVGIAGAADPVLTQIRTVYLLPMSAGMDQFIANRLTAEGRYQVVTDPVLADAIVTDRIGTEFEERMRELYPPPPSPEAEKAEAEKKDATGNKDREDPSLATLMGQASGGRRTSSFGRSKGHLFLVDRKTNRVLWSTFVRPKSTRPDDLNQTAAEIVGKLEDAARKQVKEMAKVKPQTQ